VDGIFLGHNLLLSQAFRWESLDGWDFSRPQLVVVSGLFSGNPLMDGISAIRKPFSQTFFFFHDGILAIRKPFSRTHSFFTMEFRLSRSPSHELFFFHDGILAIKEPFTRTFLFSRWNSGYQGAFHTNFSFFTMEFWLSRSLSHELFFFHDGISRHKIRNVQFGGRLFSYIYQKEYLHRIRLVKNLAS
jgi:hypothetical protein